MMSLTVQSQTSTMLYKALRKNQLASKHNIYLTLTSENTIQPFVARNNNMQVNLSVPYYLNGSSQALSYNSSKTMIHTKTNSGLSIAVAAELGVHKGIYGKYEAGFIVGEGNNEPFNMRAAIGYNLAVIKNNYFILRPEMGCTYLNRQIFFNDDINYSSSVNVLGNTFKNNSTSNQANVRVAFCENVFMFSPSMGVWLFPYASKFVLRVHCGYNIMFSQKYSVLFQNNADTNSITKSERESLNKVDISFTNTNGYTSHFFNYSGVFGGVSFGFRIH